jgi:hypothetical protein
MATAMKSWHVTVLENPCKQVITYQCVSAAAATEKLKEVKEKYIDIPADPASDDPRLKRGVIYTFFREQY